MAIHNKCKNQFKNKIKPTNYSFMRNLSFALLFTLLSSTIFAQSSFTSNNCFQLNDSSKIGLAVLSTSLDGFIDSTGNNYTWDFSSTGSPGPWTSWTSPTISYNFQPASLSIHSPFIGSEINEYALVAFARDNFYTYSSTQDTLYTEGFYNSSNKVYSPRIPYLTFPLSYSDSIYTYTPQDGGTAVGPGSVSRYWIYDGFGTLKLPYGTTNNVFRIRTHQTDSSSVLGSVLGISEELIWFSQADGIPILRLVKVGPTTTVAYYASVSGSTSIDQLETTKFGSIYPNPATNYVSYNSENNVIGSKFIISDQFGKEVLTGRLINKTTNIDISKFATGIYLFQVENGSGQTFKVLKN